MPLIQKLIYEGFMKDTVNIITLAPSRWREYKTLRLHALMQDPYAFGRTYEEDAMLPDAVWKQQLKDAQEGKTSYMLFAERAGILVGMSGAIIDEGAITQHRAKIISVYVAPESRDKGIGSQLLNALLEKLSNDPRIVIVYLLVNEHQESALKLYQTANFKQVGTFENAFAHKGQYHSAVYLSKTVKELTSS